MEDIYTCYPTETLTAPVTPPTWRFLGVVNKHHCYVIEETIKFLNEIRDSKHPKRTASPTIPPTIPPSLIAEIKQVVNEMFPPDPPPPSGIDGVLFLLALLITIILVWTYFEVSRRCCDKKKEVVVEKESI